MTENERPAHGVINETELKPKNGRGKNGESAPRKHGCGRESQENQVISEKLVE